jgi:hypothetical protein
MNSVVIALCTALVTFGGGGLGLLLRRKLPEKYTSGRSKDMISAISGLMTLLSALVTGLLIWTSYGVYANQNAAVQSFAVHVLQEYLALTEYGADTAPVQAKLNGQVARTIDEMWGSNGDADFVSRNYQAAIENLRTGQSYLDSLRPSSESQKSALAAANQAHASIGQTRLQMALALTDPVSYSLLFMVIAWITVLFCGFGLTAGGNRMAYAVMAVGAVAVSTAVFAIVELSTPYVGLINVSSTPIERVMKVVTNGDGNS